MEMIQRKSIKYNIANIELGFDSRKSWEFQLLRFHEIVKYLSKIFKIHTKKASKLKKLSRFGLKSSGFHFSLQHFDLDLQHVHFKFVVKQVQITLVLESMLFQFDCKTYRIESFENRHSSRIRKGHSTTIIVSKYHEPQWEIKSILSQPTRKEIVPENKMYSQWQKQSTIFVDGSNGTFNLDLPCKYSINLNLASKKSANRYFTRHSDSH